MSVLGGGALTLFWRAYAGVYDLIWDSVLTESINEHLVAEGALPVLPGRAVDLGCGTGLAARRLAALGYDVVGVDLSAAMLLRAGQRGRLARERCLCADAANTGLPGATFDVALASNVLHLHPDPGKVLDEAARLVRPGGTLILAWPAEGLSLTGMLVDDLSSGRGLARSIAAAVLRLVVGVPGALVGARCWRGSEVRATVGAWALGRGMTVLDQGTAEGVTEFATLRVPDRP